MNSISDKIIKNTFFNTVGNFSTTFLHLLLVPYIMMELGTEQFGIWALVSVILGIFTAFDFGGASSLVKFFSEYEAKKDRRSFNEALVSGFVMMAFFSGVILIVFLLLLENLLSFFNIPEQLLNEARFVFLSAGILFAFNNSFGVFQAVIKGLQRMEITNFINVIGALFFAFGIVIFLRMGYGLKGLILVQGAKIILINLASIFYAKKLNKDLAFSLSFLKLEQFKRIFHYGVRMQVSNIANLVNLQTDKTLIGFFLNLSFVAFYEIGQKVSLFCRMVVGVFLSALVPAVSELDSKDKPESISKLYEKGSKYLAAIAFPIMTFLIIFSHGLITTWMGTGFDRSILVVRLLVFGVAVNTLTGVGVMIVRGVGKPVYETRYALVSLILNIGLGLMLVKPYGFVGIVVATPISTVIGSLYFIFTFHKLYSISLPNFIKKAYMKPFALSVGLALGIFYLNKLITMRIIIDGRMESLALLFVDGLLFIVSFVFLLNKLYFWDSEDGSLFKEKVRAYPKIHKLAKIFV